jgi:hypothetical protein
MWITPDKPTSRYRSPAACLDYFGIADNPGVDRFDQHYRFFILYVS